MRSLIANAAGITIASFTVFAAFSLGVVANESVNAKKANERLLKENADLVAKLKHHNRPLFD